MAIEIVMPRLGWTAEEGILKEWLLADGSKVEIGDALFAVEGDKAVEEITSLDPGILRIPKDAPVPGQSVPVGSLLAYILEEGEEMPAVPAQAGTAPEVPQATVTGETTPDASITGLQANRKERVAISPRARRLALAQGINWQGIQGSGRTGRVVERDIVALLRRQKIPVLSPVARRIAAEADLEVEALQEAFPGQRISAEQVRAFISEKKQDGSPRQVVAFTPTRKAIANHLSAGLARSAPVTLHMEIDATELVRLRDQLKADARQSVPSYNVLFLKVLAHALQDHTHLNAWVEEEALILVNAINIGIAVQTDRGLLVPVIHEVDKKNLNELQTEVEELVNEAATGTIHQSQLQEGTFTITNLGNWEVDAFTPIINSPQVGILGIGRIRPKPMVVDKESIVVRQALTLSLTFDHRALDGAPAASFLQRVKKLAEQPYLWLTS